MPTAYEALRNKVVDWSNRDADIFGRTPEAQNALLGDFLRYAADKCYRHLRVPSLEFSRIFTVDEADFVENPANLGYETVIIPVPHELIEVIHIRNKTQQYVYDEKIDMRTYFQRDANKVSSNFWTRQGNNFLVTGRIACDDEIEIHYYRRLPALDAIYSVVAATYNIDPLLFTESPNQLNLPHAIDDAGNYGTFATDVLWFRGADREMAMDTSVEAHSGSVAFDTPVRLVGGEISHWLRDENERILLFGALAELFAYVGEEDMLGKYIAIFQQEIEELNNEERRRITLGGNVKINYNSTLI